MKSVFTSQSKRTGYALRWSYLIATVVLAACAAVEQGPPVDIVRARATERWQALAASNYATAYSYNTPSFKAVVTPEAFRNRLGSAAWFGAEVINVTCPEPTQCTARVRVDFKNALGRKGGEKISTHTDETWLLENGQWWLFQQI